MTIGPYNVMHKLHQFQGCKTFRGYTRDEDTYHQVRCWMDAQQRTRCEKLSDCVGGFVSRCVENCLIALSDIADICGKRSSKITDIEELEGLIIDTI